MGTVGRSWLFHSHATQPMSSILIDPNGNPIQYFPGVADTANIYAGLLVYRTATTYENEVTECPADYGDIATEGFPMAVEIEPVDIHMDENYDIDTAYADGDPIPRLLKLYPGMWIWVKGSSLTAAQDELLVHAASGLVTNVGDPDGAAIDQASYAYRALADISSGTWIPVEVVGRQAFDKTA